MTNTPPTQTVSLPDEASLPINRCNLPSEVLGDLSFQTNPKPIHIDGVAQLHKHLFQQLDGMAKASERSQYFSRYMVAHFRLEALDEAGYDASVALDRSRANYLRILRGWFFDSDSVEGAVIKSWVESRFGLLPRYHQGSIRSINDTTYSRFASLGARGLYNTNALEAQLDLLYSYCQYELSRQYSGDKSILLYRGQNRLESLEQLSESSLRSQPLTHKELRKENRNSLILLLNNISSFTSDQERAGEFGDVVICVEVPLAKLLFFSGLMQGIMTSEKEYAVIGGVYKANVVIEINRQ
jgi:NAD+--dinitrogen-reductase ADP-D-ribosyltransferase